MHALFIWEKGSNCKRNAFKSVYFAMDGRFITSIWIPDVNLLIDSYRLTPILWGKGLDLQVYVFEDVCQHVRVCMRDRETVREG